MDKNMSSEPSSKLRTASESANPVQRIGFWLAEKKWNRINRDQLEDLLRERACQLVKVNLDESLEDQGPFAAIVHKVSDLMARAEAGDKESKARIQRFEAFLAARPDIILFDKLSGVHLLMDRYSEYKLVADSQVAKQGIVYVPPFVNLTSVNVDDNLSKLRGSGVTFPLVCKPLMAHGSVNAHKMSLVFCESGMSEVRTPCVAQSFLSHNARLFKLFVIRDKCFIVERPSLKNFTPGEYPTVHFDAHSISKPDSSSSLIELDEGEAEEATQDVLTPSQDIVDAIVKEMRESLDLTLFGIDVIIEKGTGKHAVIDVNVFPGYEGVPTFIPDLVSMITQEVEDKCRDRDRNHSSPNMIIKRKESQEMGGNNDIDSGVDTSDSCDEKKKKKVTLDGSFGSGHHLSSGGGHHHHQVQQRVKTRSSAR